MNRKELFRELESILSVVEDGEYVNADLMMQSLRLRFPINHRLEYELKHAHDAIRKGTYVDMLSRLENLLDILSPVR